MFYVKGYAQGDVVAEAKVTSVFKAVHINEYLLDEEHIEDAAITYVNEDGVEEDKSKIIERVYARYLGL